MSQLTYQEMLRREATAAREQSQARLRRIMLAQVSVVMLLAGALLGGWIVRSSHQGDYDRGVMAGRMEEQEIQANKQVLGAAMLKKQGLCVYADLACGYYHIPRDRRPHRR